MTFYEDSKSARISVSGTSNTIIAAPGAGKFIAIDHINLLPTLAATVTFKSGSTNLTGDYPLDAKQAFTIENSIRSPRGVMTCAANEAFVMALASGVQVDGYVQYRIID